METDPNQLSSQRKLGSLSWWPGGSGPSFRRDDDSYAAFFAFGAGVFGL
jgi:hypothetical protein